MDTFKRIVSFLLVFVMLTGMFPTTAAHASEAEIAETVKATETTVVEETGTAETTKVEATSEPTEAMEQTIPEPVETEAEVVEEETVVQTEVFLEEVTAEAADTLASTVLTISLPEETLSGEELFAGYVEKTFYGNATTFGTAAGDRLTGDTKVAYDALRSLIEEIAAGERSSSVLAIGYNLGEGYEPDKEAAFSGSEVTQEMVDDLFFALRADLVYELYWEDKTIGAELTIWTLGNEMLLIIPLVVSPDYSADGSEGSFELNTAKTRAAANAAANAQTIVSEYSSLSDYEKLLAYKNEICDLTEYNYEAVEDSYSGGYGDPWQLIHVFDGYPYTTVVCEGYSKAYQYLCDLSSFDADITCYNVTGDMDGGGHMWNIVEIDGCSYLVDVTNCDSGWELFLRGTSPDYSGAYTFEGFQFVYDTGTTATWGLGSSSILTLETQDYVAPETYTVAFDPLTGSYFSVQTVTSNTPVYVPASFPLALGSTFLGWSLDPYSTEADFFPGEIFYVNCDMTLYAIYQEATEISATELYTSVSTSLIYSGAEYWYSYTPTISTSYAFFGLYNDYEDLWITVYDSDGYWLVDNSESGKAEGYKAFCEMTAGETYYISVTSFDENLMNFGFYVDRGYSVTYHANGGSGAPETTYSYSGDGGTLSSAVPTCSGFTFYGWATNSNTTVSEYAPGERISWDSNTDLYAIWWAPDHLLLGDVNCDGLIDLVDALRIRKYAELGTETTECNAQEFLLRADMDRDGTVTDADRSGVNRLIAGAEPYQVDLLKQITGTTVISYPKTEYRPGEPLDITDLIISIHFDNGISYPITDGMTVTGYDPYKAGNQTLTVRFYQFSTTYTVHVHSYTARVTKPTCTAKGYTTYTCSCGDSYVSDYVNATGHTEVIDPKVESTCTTTGKTEGKHCSVCGTVITAQQTIPAKGHTEVIDKAVEATCTTTGKTQGKHCSVCGVVITAQQTIPAKGHTEVIDKAVEATCTTTGLTQGKHCSVCNVVIVAQQTVPAKGHTEVSDKAVEATCTTTGLTQGKHCSVCGTVITAQQVVPAKGHTEVIDKAVEATCTTTGKTQGKHCSVCGTVITAQQTIPAKGHTEVIDKAVEATCTTTGKTQGKHCSVCGTVITAQQTIPAKGHTEVIDKAVEATCTDTGLTQGKHCSVCGTVITAQKTVPAKGHTEVIDKAVEATCTTTGLTQGKHCSVCGTVITAQQVVPAKGHTEVIDKAVEATCTTTGLTQGKHCSVCGTVITAQQVVPAKGHTEVIDKAVEATCTTTGLTQGKHCSVCGTVITAQQTIPAKGHTEVIDVAVEATCTTAGLTEGKHCSVCNAVIVAQQVVPAKGHTEAIDKAVEATCTESGLTEGKHCSVCNVILVEQTVVPAKGHTYIRFICQDCGAEAPASGELSEEISWDVSVENEELIITGNGDVTDQTESPWKEYADVITTVIVDDGVTGLGENAFAGLDGLETIRISGTVTEIDPNAFADCDSLTDILVSEDNPNYADVDGILFSKDLTELVKHPGGRESSEYTVPETVAVIGDNAFDDCDDLDIILFSGSAPEFADNAFAGADVTVYYPGGDPSWTEDVLCDYGGNVTWVPVMADAVEILNEYGEVLTGATIWVDLNSDSQERIFGAAVLPEMAYNVVDWYYDSTLAEVTGNWDGSITVTPKGLPGVMTLTAVAADNSGVAASVDIKFVSLEPDREDIPGESPADVNLLSGKNKTLKVYDADTGKALTNKQITWSMDQIYAPYAKIDAKGKITAKKVVEKVRVEAIGTIIGSEDTTVIVSVDIFPAVTSLELLAGEQMVNNQTLNVDFTDEPLVLTANIHPLDAMEGVDWVISDKKEAFATYDIDEENGTLTIDPVEGTKAGTVTIKATSTDGSKKTATVKLQFGTYAKSLTIDKSITTLTAGDKAIQLYATMEPAVVTKSGIVWSLKNADDKNYANLSSSGKITPKAVLAPVDVTIVATSKDGMVSDEHTIRILPKSEAQLVIMSGDSYVTKTTQILDVNQKEYITLTACTYGQEEEVSVTWTPLENKAARITKFPDGSLRVQMLSAGSITVTAKADDGRKATVTIKGVKLAQGIEISQKKTGITEGLEVASGKSLDLQATLTDAASKKVTWSISEGNAYATISNSGKFAAAKDLTSSHKVVVKAVAADGSNAEDTMEIMVRPIAQGVQVYSEAGGRMLFSFRTQNWWVRSNTTLNWDLSTQADTIAMAAHVYPYYGDDDAKNAMQSVTWKSSAPKIAEFVEDEEGNVSLKLHKTGSVTVTATAADGSGQKMTFKLNVIKTVTELKIDNQTVLSGKSLNLAKMVTIEPADATNKKLTWEITSGGEYATISSSGSFKAKKVTSAKTVEVTVSSQDGGASATFYVTITP